MFRESDVVNHNKRTPLYLNPLKRNQIGLFPGSEPKEEKRCQACKEKNGVRTKEQGGSKDDDVSVLSEIKKVAKTSAVAVSVSTSTRPTTEDIGTETKRQDRETEPREKSKNKSSHTRTHAIVINLDDKSRFSEEVTV